MFIQWIWWSDVETNEPIVFFTDPFIIIIITHLTTMVIAANHWNYVKSAFLFTWPPRWLPCTFIYFIYFTCANRWCDVRTSTPVHSLHAEHGYDTQSNHTFFPQFVRVYLLEQTNTINEYKRKQIELIFRQYELRTRCSNNVRIELHFTLYHWSCAYAHTHK